MGLLKFLTILTLLGFPLGEFGRYIFPQVGNAPILLNDILVGLTITVWLISKLRKKEKIGGALWMPILLFLGVCIISLLINISWLTPPQLVISSLYIVRWSMYALLYFVVKEFDTHFKQTLLLLLLVVSHVAVGVGYVQYFFYPSLKSLFHLGWDEHLYRMFSVFLDPNFSGVLFVLIAIFTAGLTFQKLHEKKQREASILGILCFFDLVAVYLTYSRSAILMLLVSIIVFLWLHKKLQYLLIAFILSAAILFLSPKSFQTEGTNIFRLTSSEARLESAKNALDIFSKHPILGVGFNAYRYAQSRYGYISGPFWIVSHAGAGTDNSFLFVLATTGICGFSLFGYLWFRILRVQKNLLAKNEHRFLAIICITSIIGVFISSLFVNSLFYVFIMEWLWLMVGLSSTENKR